MSSTDACLAVLSRRSFSKDGSFSEGRSPAILAVVAAEPAFACSPWRELAERVSREDVVRGLVTGLLPYWCFKSVTSIEQLI